MSTLRLHSRLDEIGVRDWDALHDSDNPFLAHAFLGGLERTGCLRRRWGWTPLHASLWEGGTLVAAAPGYLKDNSHGEFVFDHAWAHAHHQHGREYYPKWLVAVPYSPVTGPRLLARTTLHRQELVAAMEREAAGRGLSSLHVNFAPEHELAACEGWLAREDIQFHWRRHPGWHRFSDFLESLERRKRKNIAAERRRVAEAGVRLRVVHGDEVSADELARVHALYCLTFAEKGNSPALTLEFFMLLAQAMPRTLVLVLAHRQERLIAAAVCLRGRDTLYGRYWGSSEDVPGLHFEACYYQGIEYCLREGLDVFEPGAQGEHKIARGFMPVVTRSRHWIAEPAFRSALRPWCAQEREHTRRYAEQIQTLHNPYRADDRLA